MKPQPLLVQGQCNLPPALGIIVVLQPGYNFPSGTVLSSTRRNHDADN
jgi:hypothetical protein